MSAPPASGPAPSGVGSPAEGRAPARVELLQHAAALLRNLLARPLASYYLLVASAGLLLIIGLTMVFSATSVEQFVVTGNAFSSIEKQGIGAGVGLIAFWI